MPEHNKNHHKDNLGIKFNNPLLIIKLRLLTRSYVIFANLNNPDEQRPCAIIKVYEPLNPQNVKVKRPLKTIPI